jgi:hypothetical protein
MVTGKGSAADFQGSLTCLGVEVRTIKEQCLWSKLFEDTDDLRRGVGAFIEIYNNEWLIERLGHRTPRKAFIRTGTATPFSSHRKALDASDP